MTLNKATLIQALNQELSLNQQEAKAMVDLFFSEIKNTLEQAETVTLIVQAC